MEAECAVIGTGTAANHIDRAGRIGCVQEIGVARKLVGDSVAEAKTVIIRPQLHVNSVDDAILARMHDSGCTYISYGIESMSQPVLNSMKKRSTKTRIDKAMRWTYDHKIGIQGNIIFGDTAETFETANESMEWWVKNQSYMINLSRLQVYPGSPDYIEAVRDGLIEDRIKWIDNQDVYLNISKLNAFDAEILGIQGRCCSKNSFERNCANAFRSGDTAPCTGTNLHYRLGLSSLSASQ